MNPLETLQYKWLSLQVWYWTSKYDGLIGLLWMGFKFFGGITLCTFFTLGGVKELSEQFDSPLVMMGFFIVTIIMFRGTYHVAKEGLMA